MKNAAIILLLIIILAGGWYLWSNKQPEDSNVPLATASSFEDCVAKGFAVMESYPRQCKSPDGKSFTEDIGNSLEKQNLIRLASPKPNQIVMSPLIVEGEARGTWYFEASFPVTLYDGKGNVVARAPAEAQSEWMTENFVQFKVGLKFTAPETDTGFLVLSKDNPSGLPEHDDEMRIPIRFR
ncbi:hypothetical protein A3B18_00060 [Candidatus Giovannonibacteria bacterium RIFCSPLOWO2_01_FULL_46_13]|uniref:Bacterial spore germination immunoglobulin-like domain-containing protein n=1 Tax=Candidatus Giovannonibacteria bacterium RIFCSPLOWO2_01_FULL_46_13 TaxID=1798352 RepID=A0A1F5X336_9BACT|nr:MAG: hypothetical protein A3B18_00060 [Candidatus Giovannonibacteria bacterium RIFCSPLOWO2_01_FULL_46_13]